LDGNGGTDLAEASVNGEVDVVFDACDSTGDEARWVDAFGFGGMTGPRP
jgi:hypothetical protein